MLRLRVRPKPHIQASSRSTFLRPRTGLQLDFHLSGPLLHYFKNRRPHHVSLRKTSAQRVLQMKQIPIPSIITTHFCLLDKNFMYFTLMLLISQRSRSCYTDFHLFTFPWLQLVDSLIRSKNFLENSGSVSRSLSHLGHRDILSPNFMIYLPVHLVGCRFSKPGLH